MIDGLAAFVAGIDDDAVSVVEALGAGDLSGCPEQVTEEGAIALFGIGHGGDVLAWDDEHVNRGLGVNVGEGVAKLVLEDGGGGDVSFNDLAEEAAHMAPSVTRRL